MGKKKVLKQKDLDKMSPEEVLKIDVEQIPEGFDIEHENGANAKLVPLPTEEEMEQSEQAEEVSDEQAESPSATESEPEKVEEEKEPESKPQPQKSQSNHGILFLRMFTKDVNTGKILTRLKKKVFFPSRPIEPGWYVACVISEKDTFGEMDVIELDKVKPYLWSRRYIKGVHVKPKVSEGIMEIYPSVPKERLEKEAPACIHTCELPPDYEPPTNRPDGIRMSDLLADKEKEALENIRDNSSEGDK